MKTGFRKLPAPFSVPRLAGIDREQNLSISDKSSLDDRLLYLKRRKHSLVDARSLTDLYHTIFKVAFKNFSIEEKALVYAVFLVGDGGTIVAFPNEIFQFPGAEEPHPFKGKIPDHPIQPDLIQEAMDSKTPLLHETPSEHFLAVPLLKPKNIDPNMGLLGVLLFSNKEEGEFTDTSNTVVRHFAEYASEAMTKLMPVPKKEGPLELVDATPKQMVAELRARAKAWVANFKRRLDNPYGDQ
ncbi:MAG: hypothetical protein ABIA67_03000 [Candidatus Margulisiibacteriota bacterium]